MRGALLLAGLVLLAPLAASADPTRDEVMSGASRCEGIADNRAWLDCFYGSAQPMRSLLGLSPAPVSQTKLVPPPGASYGRVAPIAVAPVAAATPPHQKSGGFFADLIGSAKPLVKDVPMTAYSIGRDRLFTVTLQNGEVYRQIEGDLTYAKWNKPPSSYRVTIEPSGDNFVLKVKGEPGIVFHVSRR